MKEGIYLQDNPNFLMDCYFWQAGFLHDLHWRTKQGRGGAGEGGWLACAEGQMGSAWTTSPAFLAGRYWATSHSARLPSAKPSNSWSSKSAGIRSFAALSILKRHALPWHSFPLHLRRPERNKYWNVLQKTGPRIMGFKVIIFCIGRFKGSSHSSKGVGNGCSVGR
jgi:hypothetical protein